MAEQKRDVSPKRKRAKKTEAEVVEKPPAPVVEVTEEKKKQPKKKAEPKSAGSKLPDLEMAIKLLQGGFHEAALELLLALQKNATKKRAAPKKKEDSEKE